MKRPTERGFTLVEIMIVVAIIALLAAIAIPNVLRGRTSANETAAVGNVRALLSSAEMYRSVSNEYPATWLADMYGANCLTATVPNPDFGPLSFCLDLGAGAAVQGFTYTYARGASGQTYTFNANPVTLGTTGTRSFFADERGQVRHCTGTGAVLTDPTIDAAPIAC
jgi:prepilin-type N-terminal cleavage/methylation domain-containing protein